LHLEMPYEGITLRPITSEDTDFLYQVYASTRADELAIVDWSQEQKDAFLQMQFDAQHRYYQEYYANASFDVILRDSQPIGRLYLDRREDEVRIVDIAILPEHRNAGVGTALLRDIMSEAASMDKVVTIHVEKFNPALRLYRRLGFRQKGDSGVYFLLEWSPASHNPG
jgi:ribosomal protein S18 acetylase RimI-like enzyme